MGDQKILWYVLVVNLIAYIVGVSLRVLLRRLFSYPGISLTASGVVAVLLFNACILFWIFGSLDGAFLSGKSGVDGFIESVEMGRLVGQFVGPGLLFLSVIWIYTIFRYRSGVNSDKKGAAESGDTSIIEVGNKFATVIFWIIGGGFLLFAIVGFVVSRI